MDSAIKVLVVILLLIGTLLYFGMQKLLLLPS